MKTTHSFVAPVLNSTQSKVNTEAYEQAIDNYNEGKHLEAFRLLLDHLNPEFRTKYGNAEGTEFHIPHGSILVNIRIGEGKLHISADFLELPEKGRVAMLRQVADLNINRLMLPRFRKEGDKLKMEYVCPLSQSHPHKLYFILRNICHIGDRYDDEFCAKFGAKRSYEPQVTPYSEEEVTRVHEAVRQTCRETLEAVKEYEAERKYGYSWNVIDIALYKISYFAQPQGQLTALPVQSLVPDHRLTPKQARPAQPGQLAQAGLQILASPPPGEHHPGLTPPGRTDQQAEQQPQQAPHAQGTQKGQGGLQHFHGHHLRTILCVPARNGYWVGHTAPENRLIPTWVRASMMAPAVRTPRVTAGMAFFSRIPRNAATSEPVQAPVPGRGMATKSQRPMY